MLYRWLRAILERVGVHLPFAGVICVEATQTISIDEEWRGSISTRRKLVFVEMPTAGDLRDTYGVGLDRSLSPVIYSSSDAVELGREEAAGPLTLYWWPRDPIALYTLYEHESGWRPATTFDTSALCLEYTCDMRTGAFNFECLGPASFEAAVVFKRPRWPRRLTERTAIEQALKRLNAAAHPAQITDGGKRVTCDIRGAKVGERYILVVFREHGVAQCERWLTQTSMFGRAHRALNDWARVFRS
jgi:hypothetical protein